MRASAAAVLAASVASLLACRPAEPPTLAHALAVRGGARSQARAYLEVAMAGKTDERSRAAILWGLSACDVPSPRSALRAFARAAPTGALAHLAGRRLEAALGAGSADAALWLEASASPWLTPAARERLLMRGAELLVIEGRTEQAVRVLPPLAALPAPERARALSIIASAPAGDWAQRRLVIEYPRQFAATFPATTGDALRKSFTPAEWAQNAAALLEAGDADEALRAARRAGAAAALTAARAAVRLRHPSEALAWAERLGSANVDGAVERAEALRQLAWIAPLDGRALAFARVVAGAERAKRLAGADPNAATRADLVLAEGLTELGRVDEAGAIVARSFDRSQPRWDWVWRRLLLQQAKRAATSPEATAADPPASARVKRIAAYWRARRAARAGDPGALRELATSGFPDLPALWAVGELRLGSVPVSLTEAGPAAPAPPPWADDLVAAGRISDVVSAWRGELEASGSGGAEWLGLVHLAEMRPLDAIPLLVRGEPRLFAGPWNGLSHELLEQYLPLAWRQELETAARRAGVPPWLLAGLVRQESAWNPRAHSAAGAVGLAQVLPATGMEKARAMRLSLESSAEVATPATNLLLGAALLADWAHAFGGSWTAALAAYNGGERRVREVWDRTGAGDGPTFVEALEVPETWDYVHRVVLLAEGYRLLYWPEGRPFPWT